MPQHSVPSPPMAHRTVTIHVVTTLYGSKATSAARGKWIKVVGRQVTRLPKGGTGGAGHALGTSLVAVHDQGGQ